MPPSPISAMVTATFNEANLDFVSERINPDAFFESSYDSTLDVIISHIVSVEAPIREDVLAQRIARIHGWVRTGGRIRERILASAKKRFPIHSEDVGLFIWPEGNEIAHWPDFRKPTGSVPRPIDEIALPELIALAKEIRAAGQAGEEAIVAMSRRAGMQQLRAASRSRLEKAWSIAESNAA